MSVHCLRDYGKASRPCAMTHRVGCPCGVVVVAPGVMWWLLLQAAARGDAGGERPAGRGARHPAAQRRDRTAGEISQYFILHYHVFHN